jgi:Cu2+-exporting ATPase
MNARHCHLCELPVADREEAIRDAEGHLYCCKGCKEVAGMLGDLPEEERSALRKQLQSESDDQPQPVPEDAETSYFAVDGMHCTTCERFLDTIAGKQSGVYRAQSSYASDRMRISYDPTQITADQLSEKLTRGGYRVRSMDYADPAAGAEQQHTNTVARLILGGFFGMIVMMQYILFLYPTYLGYESFLDLSGRDGLFAFANIWVFSSFVLLYTGGPLLRSAWISLRMHQPNMDLLITLAAVSAYAYSAVAIWTGSTEIYFDVTVSIILAVSIGQYYQQALKRRSLQSLRKLESERAETVRVRQPDGSWLEIALSEVQGEATVKVLQGDRIPFDGQVLEGEALVDESLMTGESKPRSKVAGDTVLGGSLLLNNSLLLQVDADQPSTIDRLSELLWNLQTHRSGTQRFVDRLAAWFVPLVLVAAGLTLLMHLANGYAFHESLLTSLAVLIVSCPCALGLATPLALANGIRSALRHQLIVQSTEIFERDVTPQQVIFDKTGTLTTGQFEVAHEQVQSSDPDALMRVLGPLERQSAHPVGESLARHLSATSGTEQVEVDSISTHSQGLVGEWQNRKAAIGKPEWIASLPWTKSIRTEELNPHNSESTMTVIGVVEGLGWAQFELQDEIRPEADSLLRDLHQPGIGTYLLTGDTESATRRWQSHPHLDHVFAEVRPESKASIVQGLQQQGSTAMIGDGINDAGAMAQADMGITFGNRSALARAAGDIILPEDDLQPIAYALQLPEKVRTRIYENLGWALLYNATVIPLAAFGWINPLFAALAMISSSILVILNSSRVIR